ncbi:MAG: SRPBCC family protein [Saprospiraceae bacterium]|uniref:SRPBCC family protein n=1 Tax=Candidatus Opimibacter skivensis TaxID=2982028 RepID=A0A9D7XRU6_9BACT|nr:SRPBCC family protein [Candidatus Opimibacter skivensis]
MKLNYRYEIEIKRPLDEVVRLFSNRDLLTKWQRGLLLIETLKTTDGKKQYMLMYKLGRRKMKMTETILKDALPEQYDVNFKVKGAQHTACNSFTSTDHNTTKWTSDVEFSFSGLMNLLARFMKAGFEQQTLMYMKSFKSFAENYTRV